MKSRIAFGWIGIAIGLCFFLSCSKKKTEETAGKPASGTTTVVPLTQINLPENVVGLLTIAKPQELTQKLEALAALVSPLPTGMLSNMLSNSFSRLGMKDPKVVDLEGPMAIAVLNPNIFKDPALAFLTVKSEDAVLASLKPAWNHLGVKDGIHELSREETDTYQAFSDDKNNAPPKKVHTLYLKFLGKLMVATGHREAFNVDLGALKKLAESSEPSGAQLTLLLDRIRDISKAELATAQPAAKEAIKKNLEKSGMKPSPQTEALADWFAGKIFSTINQVRDLRIAFSARDDGLISQFYLTPENDSFFSKILAAQTPKPLHLISALPPTQLLAFAANVQWKPFKEDLKELATNVLQALLSTPPSPEWLSVIDEQLALLGDEFVVSEDITNKKIHFVELVEVADETRTNEVLPKFMLLTQKMMASSSLMAYKIGAPKALAPYDGVAIKSFELSFDTKKASPQKAKMVKQLYGDKFTLVYGVFDKLMGITVGENAESEMHQLIDRVRKHTNEIPVALKNAGGEMLTGAGSFMFFSINQAITGTMQALGQQAPVAQSDKPPSGIFMRFGSSPERFTMTLRIPADHLKELSAAMQAMIQASIMKGMMNPGPAEAPRNAP
jgi:hypothetical protein